MKKEIPNPGSQEAREQGCLCPQMDNSYGKGYTNKKGEVFFIFSGDCPLHNKKKEK